MKTVHKVCTMLNRWESLARGKRSRDKPCQECKKWQKTEHYGKCAPMCYLRAEEFINIVKTGNPWGKKGVKWPNPERNKRSARTTKGS